MGEEPAGLTRKDWMLAGLTALAAGGIEAVKVERIAATLGVSKGSFYWHFTGRADLLASMLDFFERDFTARLIANAAHLGTPRARLLAVAEQALEAKVDGIDVAEVEGAFSAWAALDKAAGARVRATEDERMRYIVKEVTMMGAAPDDARFLAKGIYLALLGLYAARRYNPTLADDEAFRRVVVMALDAAERAATSQNKRRRHTR